MSSRRFETTCAYHLTISILRFAMRYFSELDLGLRMRALRLATPVTIFIAHRNHRGLYELPFAWRFHFATDISGDGLPMLATSRRLTTTAVAAVVHVGKQEQCGRLNEVELDRFDERSH